MTLIRPIPPPIVAPTLDPLAPSALPWEGPTGGAPAYNPQTDLPSLFAYWRADLGVVESSGGIETWTDQEASTVLTRPGTTADPVLVASDADFGGGAVVDFGTGTTAVLRDSAARALFRPLHDGTGVTLLFDLLIEESQTATGVILDTNNTSTTLAGCWLRFNDTGTLLRFAVGNGTANVIDASTSAISKGARHTVVVRYASSPGGGAPDCDIRVDGASLATQASESNAPAAGDPANVLAIGNRSASTTQQLDGRIREIAMCSAYLTDAQVAAWEAWAS